jgi:2-succinyl-5-enolpyruvyl-6-hydroxy-3-cyclohexene-1-carboxylate synthase
LVLAAARERRLTVHPIVDERSAAFFALGQARVTGSPSLLLCTSGTAAAHYLPAVVEASQARVPLLVFSSDRPPELHHRAAPQTIDQVKLFGGHVRRYFELGAPDDHPRALAGLGATAALAVQTSLAPNAGPVHLNAWFRKPLEPVAFARLNEEDARLRAAVEAERARPLARAFAPMRVASPRALQELAALCRERPRGVIVCGSGPLANAAARPALKRLAEVSGFPVLAEATSQLRDAGAPCVELFDPLLRCAAFFDRFMPQLVLQVGEPPTSKGFELLIDARPDLPRWTLVEQGWNDPFNSAHGHIEGELAETLRFLADALAKAPSAAPGWAEAWGAAGKAAKAALERLVAERPNAEAAFVRALGGALPAGSLLMVGNGLPVREVDLFSCGGARGIGVLCQRGANGIDGLVSGAAGAASVAGRPVTLLCGDVSLVHDLGGLSACSGLRGALNLVVVGNGGGRMFELLPIASDPELRLEFERYFLTPCDVRLEPLAAAHGLAYLRVETPEALAGALGQEGVRLIEVEVGDRDTRGVHRRWQELVEEEIRRSGLAEGGRG